jgi:hypothetical protein
VAETVPAGGVAVTNPLVPGLLLHVAETGVVAAAPATTGVAISTTTATVLATRTRANPQVAREVNRRFGADR